MTTDFYTQIMPFFGYDGRGTQFVNLNYKGTDYESPLNNIKYPDTIRGEPLFQLMIAQNYVKDNINYNPNDTDIHYEFVDFIIRTALIHRNIDVPTSTNQYIIVNKNKFESNLKKSNSTYYINILKIIVDFLVSTKLNITETDNTNNIMDNLIQNNKNETIIFFRNTVYELIKNTTVFSEEPYVIAEDVDFYEKFIIPAINDTILLTLKEIYLYKKDISVKDLNDKSIFEHIKNILIDTFTTNINKALDRLLNPDLNKLFNHPVTADKAKDFFDNVYRMWGSLKNDVRKFYISYLMLMHKGPAGNWLILNSFDKFGSDYDNYRMNFKKTRRNKDITIFNETLPFIPSVTENLWFTNNNQIIEKLDLSKLSDNDRKAILQIIYLGVYNTGKYFELHIDGKTKQFEININIVPKPRFNLNYPKFISNVISNFMKFQTIPIDVREDFDDLYVDLTTNLIFNKDNNGLYQMVNGNKVYYDDARLQNDLNSNCYGTYLKNSDNNCGDVCKCILNNNPQNLVRCLNSLREEALFDVAKSDIININPKIMRNIIKTFGFTVRKETDGIYRPLNFNEWINSPTIPSEVKHLVQSNRKLRIYLGEILNVIRKNPIILDENIAEQQKDYSRMNMNVFKQPLILERPTLSENVYRDLLTRTNMPNKMELPLFVNLSNVNVQYGGGNNSLVMKEDINRISNKLKRLFNGLFEELVSAGKELKDEDKIRIENAIEKFSNLEVQLNALYEDIKMYANIQKMMVDTNAVEETDLGEIHDFNNNKQRINEAYNKIQLKIQKNMLTQHNILNALYSAQMPMIRMLGF